MNPVLLVAGNFLRQQRWAVVLMVLYVGAYAALIGFSRRDLEAGDLAFFIKQLAFYGVVFSAFLMVSAIHNDFKSRRILAVLSKSVRRSQYLLGLLLGCLAELTIYFAAVAVSGAWLVGELGLSLGGLLSVVIVSLAAATLVAVVTLFFTTFMTPVFATVAAGLVIGAPMALERALTPAWGEVLPVARLLAIVANSPLEGWDVPAVLVVSALAQAAAVWALASAIFARRDVTVAVE